MTIIFFISIYIRDKELVIQQDNCTLIKYIIIGNLHGSFAIFVRILFRLPENILDIVDRSEYEYESINT